MKLTKKCQAALLFVIKLGSGRTSVGDAALDLDIPKPFLEQIARSLRLRKLVRSVRGPGGGYELTSDPTVLQVFGAVGFKLLVSDEVYNSLKSGNFEKRSMAKVLEVVATHTLQGLGRKLSDLNSMTVLAELKQLESPSPSKLAN